MRRPVNGDRGREWLDRPIMSLRMATAVMPATCLLGFFWLRAPSSTTTDLIPHVQSYEPSPTSSVILPVLRLSPNSRAATHGAPATHSHDRLKITVP